MNDTTQIQIETVDDPAELLEWQDGQLQPETVYLYLDPEANDDEGRLSCASDSGQCGTPSNVWHGRMRRFAVPLLSAHGANALMASSEVQELAARIVAGYSHDWDGSNHVGTVDDDATEAEEALDYFCRDWDGEKLDVWEADVWLEADSDDIATRVAAGEWSSQEAFIEWLRDEACNGDSEHGHLVVRGVADYAEIFWAAAHSESETARWLA